MRDVTPWLTLQVLALLVLVSGQAIDEVARRSGGPLLTGLVGGRPG